MKVLVTGDAGFVGRHFAARLKADGHHVVGLDIKRSVHEDVRNFFMEVSEQFDMVVHCAAIVGGRLTIEKDPLAVATDLAIDAAMFNWAVRNAVERVVYFSSSAAYPVRLQRFPNRLVEDDINLDTLEFGPPDLTYGWAKLTGEYLADFARREGTRVHVVRPFSGYGEDQDLDYPFPAFIDRALRRQDPFPIWGDGTQVRDFIHIDDIVDATLRIVELDIEFPVNLGTGRPMFFRDLAAKVCEAAGYSPELAFLPDQPTGPWFRCAQPDRLHTIYRPRITLEEGIRRALDEGRVAA